MYGLKQAGLLANERFIDHLAKYDYIQSKYGPCLFTSKGKSTAFCLIVDDLLIKGNKPDHEPLYDCLRISPQTIPDPNTST